jgi:GT2 family glycosyltransferase
MSPDLSIIIFTRNDAGHLRRCLASLAAAPPRASFETLVIDNASRDETLDVAQQAPLPTRCLTLAEDTSFSVGNNLGLRESTGASVLFLNPDTLPCGDVIDRCLEVEGGLVSPRLRWPDGTPQPTGWHLPTPGRLLREHLGGAPREVPPDPDGVTRVGWLMGCFLLGRRARIGAGFDEAFWFHGTDLELCARVGGCVRVEDVEMVHVGHRAWDAARRREAHGALLQWLRRDHGTVSAELVGAAARFVEAVRS